MPPARGARHEVLALHAEPAEAMIGDLFGQVHPAERLRFRAACERDAARRLLADLTPPDRAACCGMAVRVDPGQPRLYLAADPDGRRVRAGRADALIVRDEP